MTENIVDSVINTPFSQRHIDEKLVIKREGRPTSTPNTTTSDHGVKRTFQQNWFQEFKWLTVSVSKGRAFCWPCLLFPCPSGHITWTEKGYYDWKNFVAAAKKHESSQVHISANVKLQLLGQVRIDFAINDQIRRNHELHNERVKNNREVLKRFIDIVIYLSASELAFRGHDEAYTSVDKGNYMELIELLARYDPTLRTHLDTSTVFRGTSKTIQNDLIGSIEEVLNEYIFNEITNSNFFSFQMDETTDVSAHAQATFIIRFVDSSGCTQERFLGFKNCSESKNAENLSQMAFEAMSNLDPEHKLVCQTYDGASVMAGELGGLQAKVRERAPQALFVHCYAHRLNLVLSQSASSIPKVRIFFATLTGFPAFFNRSPKRTALLESGESNRIPAASNTRWNFRSRLVGTVLDNFANLKDTFLAIKNTPGWDFESVREATGYIKAMEDFDFVFLLVTFHSIFELCDVVYSILQTKKVDISFARKQLDVLKNKVSELRTDEKFDETFNTVLEILQLEEPPNSRSCRRGSLITDQNGKKDPFKRLYNEVLDNVWTQLANRFSDMESLQFAGLIDSEKFDRYTALFPDELMRQLKELYGNFFNFTLLKNQLVVVYSSPDFRGKSVSQLISLFLDLGLHVPLSEVYRLLLLVQTIPVTTASSERSFSCLKRVKTCLRNTMGDVRLSALAKLAVEKDLLKKLSFSEAFYAKVIDVFAQMKERRVELIYK